MRVINSQVIHEKPPSKRPGIRSRLRVQPAGDWKNRWSVRSLRDRANRSVEGSMPEAQSRV